jgi:hypothetical protein
MKTERAVRNARKNKKREKFIVSATLKNPRSVASPKAKATTTLTRASQEKTKPLLAPKAMLPTRTIGRLIKKLKRKAVVLSKCLIKRQAIVVPDRESPGRTESPWTSPKLRVSAKVMFLAFLIPWFLL